ncbi:MAG: hypothetical protein KY446_01480 [Proteobacteria bacterium]|nr:hypothetical protein [Pseudomonadota bacterium]
MRTLLIALIGWLLAWAAQAQAPECAPVPGVEALWAKPETRFVLFGEFHGATEIPALFGDVICHARTSGRAVKVALELEEQEQAALDAFMASDEPQPRFVFQSSDGRRSEAMILLLRRLRDLRNAGQPFEVVAFRRTPSVYRTQVDGEAAMASALRDLGTSHPRALVIGLMGNVHALKSAKPLKLPFTPAAAFLPSEGTVSVLTTLPGGVIAACTPEGCGPKPWPARGAPLPRGVHLKAEPGMDGRFSVGRPFTPSPSTSPAQPRSR